MFKATIVGNLGAEPEVRYTQSGKQLAEFRMAVNDRRRNSEGETEEITTWVRVRTMRSVDYLSQYGEKGGRALVVGNVQIGTYVGRDGETRVSVDVWADEVMLFQRGGGRRDDDDVDERQAAPAGAAERAPRSSGRRSPAPADDTPDLEDLPF